MSTAIAAIPTKVDGIQFRSRLEARWSCIFDEFGWEWEYEPVDLHGYIPDFILNFPYRPVLVEVKPFEDMSDQIVQEAKRKIQKSGWKNDAIIVGPRPWTFKNVPMIGAHGAYVHSDKAKSHYWWNALLFNCRDCNDGITFIGNSQECSVRGCRPARENGDYYLSSLNYDWLLDVWNCAGNRVQYKGMEATP